MIAPARSSATEQPNIGANERVRRQIYDALALVDYAVGSGFKTADGHPIAAEIISVIETTVAKLGVSKSPRDGEVATIPAAEWVNFELAYYKLAVATAPVTAETLRDTADPPGLVFSSSTGSGNNTFWERASRFILGSSPAHRFTRGLWIVAIGFVVFVLMAEGVGIYGKGGKLFPLLIPYAYGGLGSCVYLLKSAHTFIYQRTFDVRRKPEYFNRILLGTIAGGAIILFVNQVVTKSGATQLSSAALGFLAGYSTDFLFNTIERIIGALFPKTGVETVRGRSRAQPGHRTP